MNKLAKISLGWAAIIGLIALIFALLGNIMLPFVAGLILAYFLRPLAVRLEKHGVPHALASLLIIACFVGLILLFSFTIAPILYHQLADLLKNLPKYLNYLEERAKPLAETTNNFLGIELFSEDAGHLLQQASKEALKTKGSILGNIWQSGVALVNLISLLVITPIVTFYLIKDWEKILNKLAHLVPRQHLKIIAEQCREIDKTLSAYIHGQINVCLMLGAFYALALNFVGLDYGFLIGFFTGILCFIPYIGVMLGMFVGLVVALFQFNDLMQVGMVLAVFLIGQFIEGNFVTPKLVGSKVGIHPVGIIFALLAGGSLFGFLGVLFAIPAAAVLMVLLRYAKKSYLMSNYYNN